MFIIDKMIAPSLRRGDFETMKKSILKKYFFISLTIVVLYTVLIIIIISTSNYNKSIEEKNYSNQIFLAETSESIDTKFNTALQYSTLIKEKISVQNYISSSENPLVFFPSIYDDIVNSLTTIDQMNLSIGIQKSFGPSIVSQDGYFLFDDYLKHIGIDSKTLNSSIFKEDTMNTIYFVKNKEKLDKNKTTFISKYYYPETNEYLLLFVTFPNESLLPVTTPNINDGTLSILDSDPISYFSKKDSIILDYEKFKVQDLDESKSPYYKDLSILNTKTNYNIYTHPSLTFKNIDFIYSVQKSTFIPYLFDSLSISFMYILPLLMIGCVVIYFSTKKSYNPIENILLSINTHKEISELDNYTPSKYNELDYILDNIDHIAIENQQLRKKVDDSLSSMQNDFIVSVMHKDLDEIEVISKLKELRLSELEAGGTIVILSAEGISREESAFSETNLLIMRSKIIRTIVKLDDTLFFLQFPLDYKTFCFVFSEKNSDVIYDQLSKISSYVEMELAIDLTFSVSKPVVSIFDFCSAFNEAIYLNKKKYAYLDTQIILPTSLPIIYDDNYSYSLDNERFLMNAVIDHHQKKAETIVENILVDNLFQMKLDEVNIIKLKYILLNTIKRILNYYNKSFKEFSEQYSDLFKSLEGNNPEEVYSILTQIFDHLYNTVIPQAHKSLNPLIISIIEYIEANYTMDISLTDIADKFNLTEGYVSKLLTKNANIQFKTYINSLKIKQAKLLLMEGKNNVSEVSTLVGYKNVNSFIRIFKKLEGITPGEFSKIRS